ncbi:bifunctional methylenetetrahydrofolate dehydrogenase/methenyltetrahydrofolate cyclohydrolase [Bacillus sp. FJAT-27225]|uniref:bifunctional methylenetetrahydrofolate dehydrogenase/methenyltetrahydrofolate cyclohydrolase FolD n=1 Tax=Bacillus sp. FJAT-27225 TaxID=1743144 RepID=UPI00080C35AD|nr:bifunctional methylenetetrahydrofolate dehydrogenase/methenyltetrahydrofolate cyclohydrolase FolD [Bacillus sp. FJAT-27225]OCA91048.1 bifunctional methylenetetrahydrofolate dehydrogenase/methenyltetrahydrofolate cyclohydrolase [Bacillus sp. FJAT-27225]
MAAELINGKEIAKKKRQEIAEKVSELKERGIHPGLAVILVGEDHASRTYVRNKEKACGEAGIKSLLYELPASISQDQLLEKIEELNTNDDVHGILVQLPLPAHIEEKTIIEAISPEKDVDGFHPINIGRMMTGQDAFLPCTPYGIMVMLDEIGLELTGKHVVVVGRSNIVGKPSGQLFLNKNATVTYCHSRTTDLEYHTRQADILVSAIGKPNFIRGSHIKEGATVIDVGINRNEEGKLCGDVHFGEVSEKAAYITPVPGGVGPMTITMLLFNTLKAASQSKPVLSKA